MPKKYFVTRHRGAIKWAAESGVKARKVEPDHFDTSLVLPGDVVMGTLPVHLAADVQQRGGRYWHLCLDTPVELRGKELTPEQMQDCGARLEEFSIVRRGERVSQAADVMAAEDAQPQPVLMLMIASAQSLPNALPARQYAPDRAVIYQSSDAAVRDSAHRVAALFPANRVSLRDLPDGDYATLHAYAEQEANRLMKQHPDHRLVLNATGGNKPMSLAFTHAFGGRAEIIYCDTQSDSVQVLEPVGAPCLHLREDLLDLGAYLAVQGFPVHRSKSDADPRQVEALVRQRAELSTWLARHMTDARKVGPVCEAGSRDRPGDYVSPWISQLHLLAERACPSSKEREKRPFRPTVEWEIGARDAVVWREVGPLLDQFGIGNLQVAGSRMQVTFNNQSCAEYASGGYLEEYAYLCALEALRTAGSGDATRQAGLNVRLGFRAAAGARAGGAPRDRNELDVALVWRNRLLILECKAGRQIAQPDKSQDILNKLEQLKATAGGSFGRAWVVTSQNVEASNVAVQRAHDYRLDLCTAPDMAALPQRIARWLGVVDAAAVLPLAQTKVAQALLSDAAVVQSLMAPPAKKTVPRHGKSNSKANPIAGPKPQAKAVRPAAAATSAVFHSVSHLTGSWRE